MLIYNLIVVILYISAFMALLAAGSAFLDIINYRKSREKRRQRRLEHRKQARRDMFYINEIYQSIK